MRLSLVATLRRHRAIAAALSAAFLVAVPSHAQATATQPAKTTAPKTTAAPKTTMAQPPAPVAAKAAVTPKPAAAKKVVYDINTASAADLKNIPGVGDAYAAKIIAGRPYTSKSQLVSKKIMPQSLYKSISSQIVAKK
ncbi:MAG: helix-hairpin-helix domain-containing protein [Gemmatimonas sp.]